MKKNLWLAALAFALSACASQPAQTPETADSANQAVAAAEAAVTKADSTGFAWRDSEKWIEEAMEAAV